MRIARAMFAVFALALLGGGATGCDRIRELAPTVHSAAIVPGHSQNPRDKNVIPTHSPDRMVDIVVEDERTLGAIARRLGVTVEDIMFANQLSSPEIKVGQTLTVRASPEHYARFLADREVRKTRRAARMRKRAEQRKAAAMKAVQAAKKRKPRSKRRRKVKRAQRTKR